MKKLNFVAPINGLSYGIASLNLLKELTKLGCEASLFPLGNPQVDNQEDHDLVKGAIQNSNKYDKNAPCVRLYHQFSLAEFVGKGKHIGFPIFELDQFNELEAHHLSNVDELFVCSQWASDIIKANGIDVPTKVVPLGVDTDLFKPSNNASFNKVVFLNCGKWEVRKGHDFLGEVFLKTFPTETNVELWMMPHNFFNTPEENAQWDSMYKSEKIKILPRVNTRQEVYNIMSMIDCGVFPSRAEGWNLGALEVLACGKHLIATNYSAHTEFCTKENSRLIDISDSVLAYDNKWFFGQGKWANIGESQKEQLSVYMREFYESRLVEPKINLAGASTASQFTWANSARKMLSYVLE